MNKKTLVAAGIVVAGLGYLAFQPKSDIPNTVIGKQAVTTSGTTEKIAPAPGEPSTTDNQKLPSTTTSEAEANPATAESKQAQAAVTPTEAGFLASDISDDQKAERLKELVITKGSDADKYVDVQSIVCEKDVCTVDAVAKDSSSRFQMAMATLLSENPWLGDKMEINTAPGNRGIATFKFYKE